MVKILVVDFDGVLHSYTSGWQGAGVVSDPPVPGAMRFLIEASKHFEVHIYSSRTKEPLGIFTMRQALFDWMTEGAEPILEEVEADDFVGNVLKWPMSKPAAFLTLDDRVICFKGEFPSMDQMSSFKPWNKP